MLDPSNDPNWWLRYGGYALFAAIGGFVGHVIRTIDKDDGKVNWWKAVAQGLGAGFVGLLVLMACQASGLSEQWTGLVVGVSGWLGASTTILALEKLVWGKLGVKRSEGDGNAS